YFLKVADNLLEGAELLVQLMNSNNWEERSKIIDKIKEKEKKGDDYTHEMFDLLNVSFITPFDREDIHNLITAIDDVLDFINGTSQRMILLKPQSIPTEFIKLADLILEGCKCLKNAIYLLDKINRPEEIKKECIHINEIENVADDVYHLGISQLFEKETNTIELIKNKEIYQTLEKATDKLEDASDVIKTIIIKQS
ncbi:MAG: DUF47 family protein, partial [Bacteroidales bacterium]|nr:DUF47 family protein [Bacteroidales bacterium]